MTVTDQIESLRQVLDDWADPRGGSAIPVSNMKELWNQAMMSSQKPRILICYMGEKTRGPFGLAAIMGRLDQQWAVAVTRGRGFAATRGESLTKTVGNMDPFLLAVEQVRDLIRNINGVSMEQPVDYKAIKPMQMGQLVIDGYLIEFSTANDLPVLETAGT
jgi:hypothetical protein